ncbi:MAG: cystathionine beta-lyase [Stappia sp.]|uniref:cystathionine beta-lyase n=1 Tax=Stappia sp. TaxID=1870903 RepID=UPI000C37AA03|nr:cystathionine beta-lyase [Stappia sp.]MAA99633.1 cystathionine beta-lyase [Stappia sp.]MBM18382.1 cystathionine beta-lyase [Stappia sp.]
MSSSEKTPAKGLATRLAHMGRYPKEFHGFVNPPVVHASTVLFPDTKTMLSGAQTYHYARRGNPTTNALEDAVAELEGAHGAHLAPSGLGAVSLALLSAVSSGDHLLVTDSVYGPTRNLAEKMLKRMGVEVDYYDPTIGAGIAELFKPNTRAVMTEAPGSLTFEMQDLPAIVEAAHARDALVVMDNTWATPVYFDAIGHGVDLSVQAGTKYLVGHSDAMLGTVAASERAWERLDETYGALGMHVAPDDVYLGLRGLRTLKVRLERHMESGLEIARWLEGRPEVSRVRHPGLESDPGHALWARDFTGASGLFAFDFTDDVTFEQSCAFLDALELFGLGYSWGGFESLAIPVRLKGARTATPVPGNASIRLHIGLEDTADIRADLEAGFAALRG